MHRIPAFLLLASALLLTTIPNQRISAQVVQDDNRQKENSDWLDQKLREQAKQRNVERQQNLKRDTAKLLELATELKQYVDRSNENMLSLDVVKKCDEIEKLAKDVKNKMKGT